MARSVLKRGPVVATDFRSTTVLPWAFWTWLGLSIALLGACPGLAHAQTVQPFTDIAVTRRHEAEDRPAGKPYYYISREDCLANDVLTFDLVVASPDPAYSFQVWASDGETCTDDDERSTDEGECWLVYSETVDSTTPEIQIPVQNIAAAKRPRTTSGSVSEGDETSCANDIDVGITLYFMFVGGGVVQGTPATWQTKLDLKGPAAPTDVEAGIGDERLVVEWDVVSGDKTGYRIYCEESSTPVSEISSRRAHGFGRAALLVDSGAGGSAGGASGGGAAAAVAGSASSGGGSSGGTGSAEVPTDSDGAAGASGGADGATSDLECTTSLVAGTLPPSDAVVCGEVDVASSDNGTASGLTNSVVYAVAVSAVDELGNPGPLSNVDCQAPEDLDEFFEAYRRAGGQGGGGFCSVDRGTSGSIPWLLAASTLLGLLWRRKERTGGWFQ